jgi:hypothetical protein
MSGSDLLSSTLNWPGKGMYGLKSSGKCHDTIEDTGTSIELSLVLQTTENNMVKQSIVSDHMNNHYRRLNSARGK